MTASTTGDASIHPDAIVGHKHVPSASPPDIGSDATVRAGTIIYCDVTIGDRFSTGHHALVREETEIGDDVLVGTNAVVDGKCVLGSDVSLQTGAYVPSRTTIGDRVFLGPHAVLTNDPYPVRVEVDLEGVVTTLWEPSHPSIEQVGLLADESGRIKFTAWKKSRVAMVEEGERVRFRSVARNWYRGRVSVALTGWSRVVFPEPP